MVIIAKVGCHDEDMEWAPKLDQAHVLRDDLLASIGRLRCEG